MRISSSCVLFLLASLSLVLFSQAQRAQRSYTGYLESYSSYVSVDVYCGTTTVISSTLFASTTSSDSTSLDSFYYSSCASRLSNDIDEPFTVVVSDGGVANSQNITVQESSFLSAASESSGRDFYPNTPKTIVLFPGFVYSSSSRISYNFTVAVIGSRCGDGVRESALGEECEEFGIGCDSDTCTCRSSYYVDTVAQSNVDCLYSPSDYGAPLEGFSLWIAIFVPIFVVIIILSVVMRVLFIRGVIACCGVRRPRTTVTTTTTVVEPVSTTTTTTVQTQQYPQPQVTEVAYYPQPQQYPPQQQQQHVMSPPQQHVMQYPQQYPPQQPNVDGPVVPPTQYSQPVVPQQQYPPQPYPEQPSPYNYPGANAPVQGGYVVYSPPPQNGAFQPPK